VEKGDWRTSTRGAGQKPGRRTATESRRVRYRRGVKVAQVCPYSLTWPGGVQGQVMGLARALQALNHETRVLGPCDGPPPAPFVTPLGQSIPTASNGSMAPIAPDPACALRTIRALRDETMCRSSGHFTGRGRARPIR
jgi:hypothetical protein